MKNLAWIKMLGVAGAILVAANTNAVPIEIANSPFTTQPGNNGDTTIANWVASAVTFYNAGAYTGSPLPTPGSALNLKVDQGGTAPSPYPTFGANTHSITIPISVDYIVLIWGAPGGTIDYLYYTGNDGGLSDTFNVPSNANALSGYETFGPNTNSVPDGGSTAMLLGLAGLGLFALKRKMKAA